MLYRILNLILIILIIVICRCGGEKGVNDSKNQNQISLSLETVTPEGSIINKPLSQNTVDALENTLNSIIEKTHVVGISAAVAITSKGIWTGTRGNYDNKHNKPITSKTIFYAGSIGKIFTAVTIFALIENKQLSLKSTLDKWFPNVDKAADITIEHLLMHTSGISDFKNKEEYETKKHLFNSNPEEISVILEALKDSMLHFTFVLKKQYLQQL